MTNTQPAGWYADPENSAGTRWWDGVQWTDHRTEPYTRDAVAATLKAPEGTRVNTPWIWLIIVIPLLPTLALLTVDWTAVVDLTSTSAMGSMAFLASPGYLIGLLGGWVSYGLCAWFAYLDWRELRRREVPRPFHFAWVFLSSVLYVIGRAVVARRRAGHGIAPMWVAIGTLVLSFAFAIYMMVVMFASIFQQVETFAYNGLV